MDQAQQEELETAKLKSSSEELWSARDLMPLLGYTTWENFSRVVARAKSACQKAGFTINDHFRKVTKMIELGKRAVRPVEDFRLTRYACYLIAQNGDPRITQIARAQTYFAVQTRRQELNDDHSSAVERVEARKKLTETEKKFASTLFKHRVDGKGVARVRAQGDIVLFGNNTTDQMKKRLGTPSRRPLADFLPTVTIKAKRFSSRNYDLQYSKEFVDWREEDSHRAPTEQ